jgi:hypothetical protein
VSNAPFAPGFGTAPEVLAGRDRLRADLRARLKRGERVTRALYGPRGVGKTVLLDDFGDFVRTEHGWPVVSHQVIDGEPICEALALKLVPAVRELLGRRRRVADAVVEGLTVGVDAGVTVTKTFRPDRQQPTRASLALEQGLVQVGEHAARRNGGVVLLIDEIQASDDRRDLAGFSRAVQTVNRSRLPVHLLVAGLSDARIRRTKGATFLERLDKHQLGNLDPDATRVAILAPLSNRSVSIDADALDAMVTATRGYPFFVQLLGARTWEAAGGRGPITIAHVASGIDAASDTVHQLYLGRWNRLSPQGREFVAAMVDADPAGTNPVAIGAIAQQLGKTSQDLSMIRDSLINDHQLVTPGPRRGELVFTLPYFAQWSAADPDEIDHPHLVLPTPRELPAP